MAPVLALLVALIRRGIGVVSLDVIQPHFWDGLGRPVTFVAVLFIGDFISYCVIGSSTRTSCGRRMPSITATRK